jgi:hypothetical protein
MQASIRLLSYYEISVGLAARIGAGTPNEILSRYDRDPSLLVCFREPLSGSTNVRLRFGMATLTDEGPIPELFLEGTESHGAWAGTLNCAIQAMDSLSDPMQHALTMVPVEASTTWRLLDLCRSELHPVSGPDPQWIECDAPAPELLAEALVRFSGSAEAFSAILSGLWEAKGQRESDAIAEESRT